MAEIQDKLITTEALRVVYDSLKNKVVNLSGSGAFFVDLDKLDEYDHDELKSALDAAYDNDVLIYAKLTNQDGGEYVLPLYEVTGDAGGRWYIFWMLTKDKKLLLVGLHDTFGDYTYNINEFLFGGLPTVSEENNGSTLRVVNGEWQVVATQNAEEVEF